MLITKRMLVKHDACPADLRAFEQHYPNGLDTDTLNKQGWIDLVKSPVRRCLGWAAWARLLPRIDLSGADLSGADLTWADLHQADLTDACLDQVDLSDARLHGADLCGADLSGAKMQWASLHGAMYDRHTKWPRGFDPEGYGCILIED